MEGFNYILDLSILGDNALTRLINKFERFENKLDEGKMKTRQLDAATQRLGNNGGNVFASLRSGLSAYIGTAAIALGTMSSLGAASTMEGMNDAIVFASQSAGAGAQNLEFLNKTIKELKLPVQAAYEGFKTLLGSTMGTNLTQLQVQDLYESVGMGSKVMKLTEDATKGVLLALGQMASKGKVSAEELRQQLGERLPGATGIAARAMGVTQAKFNEMLERGEIMAEDFLPLFAKEMRRTFEGGVPAALKGAQSSFISFNNELFDLKTTLGQELVPAVKTLIDGYLVPGMQWIKENLSTIGLLTSAFIGLKVAIYGINGALALKAMWANRATISILGLNAALWSNPIAFVILAVGLLAGAFIYAYNKFETFRGVVWGTWEVFKEFGKMLYEQVIEPLLGVGKILIGAFTFDKGLITEGVSQLGKTLTRDSDSLGHRIGKAFATGYVDGIGSKIENPLDQPGVGDSPDAAAGDTSKALANSINEGGRTQKNISISLDSLVKNLNINSANIEEGASKIREALVRELLQVLNAANQMQ